MRYWDCRPRQRKPHRRCCARVDPEHPIERPDLAIYSQDEQLSLGSVPSWDNPDMITNSWGPFRLNPESSVVVRNLSPTVSAANSVVHFYTSPFGIGTPRQLLATRLLSIPPGSQATLNFPLDSVTLGGDQRIGIHVRLEHPHDDKTLNNAGSQVHDGAYTTESGRSFSVNIPVLNHSNFTREIQLTFFPEDLTANLKWTSHLFAPHEQKIVTLNVEVPGALVGAPGNEIHRAVTVVARLTTGELIGGATRLLRINN